VNVKGKTVLVLGLGETGLAAAKWLSGRGARLRVADSRAVPPGLAELRAASPAAELHLGAWRDASFEGVDVIAISPGLPRDIPQVQAALARGIPVVGDVELFACSLSMSGAGGMAAGGMATARPRILAITGTNGKTTVTALTGAMCRAAGLDVEVAGNISPAVLDALADRESRMAEGGVMPQAWVLELSSFQLESTESLSADAATVLNLTEDHLDRHGGMRAYGEAKARIFQGQGVQVLNRDDAASLAMARPGRRVITFGLDAPHPPEGMEKGAEAFGLLEVKGERWLAIGGNAGSRARKTALMPVKDLRIAGLHNAANALAALALCHAIGLPMPPLLAALREFRGLPHRVELVAERGGVRWYDDSKGTNVGSTVAALAGLHDQGTAGGRLVLIAGGEGKGQDFSPLAPAVAATTRAVLLIGRDAPLIEKALAGSGMAMRRAASLEEAVQLAAAVAQPGDAVLLSPACASFDMFRNYKQRGEVFCAAVRALPQMNGEAGHA
jgi:UDP-N-acetylmuramoylalanine--D-glutamate ligase